MNSRSFYKLTFWHDNRCTDLSIKSSETSKNKIH